VFPTVFLQGVARPPMVDWPSAASQPGFSAPFQLLSQLLVADGRPSHKHQFRSNLMQLVCDSERLAASHPSERLQCTRAM